MKVQINSLLEYLKMFLEIPHMTLNMIRFMSERKKEKRMNKLT